MNNFVVGQWERGRRVEKGVGVPGGRAPRGPLPQKPPPHILNKSMATTTAGSSAQASSSAAAHSPILATGDWTKNLVHLAKTAELKCVPATSSYLPSLTLPLDPLRSRCILISGSLPLAFLSIAPNICHNLPGGVRRDPRMSLSMRDDAWNVKEACPDAAAAHGAHPLRARRARTEEQGDPGSQGAEEQVCTLGLMTAAADV